MNEQLKNLIEDYKKTDWKDLLKEKFGDYNLKEIKPHLDFIKSFIDPLVESPHKLSANQQNRLIELITEFINRREQIKTHTDAGQNQAIVNDIIGFKESLKKLFTKAKKTESLKSARYEMPCL